MRSSNLLNGAKMAAQRNEKGQFARGWKGGPGRPRKARDERYYEILQKRLTFEKWGEIVGKAIEQAIDGDKDARRFLAGYAMGEPDRYLEIAGEGGGPLTYKIIYENADDSPT